MADCCFCDEPLDALDEAYHRHHGTPPLWHRTCLLRCLVGGVHHQQGVCMCCGGDRPPDPPGLTRREAAKLATEYYRTKRADHAYSDPRYPPRPCDGCGKVYTGPALYCSLCCAAADA